MAKEEAEKEVKEKAEDKAKVLEWEVIEYVA